MRTFRMLVLAALAAGSLTVLAPAANASAPAAVSKVCKSLKTLQKELDKVDPSDASNFDFDQLQDIGAAFRKAARTAPRKLKSALNTIGNIYSDMGDADNVAEAVQAFSRNAQKWTRAFGTFTTYLTTNCIGTS